MSLLEELAQAVEYGKTADVAALIERGVAEGVSAQDMLSNGLIRGMKGLGVKFKNHQVFVPEVLIAARTLKKGSETLKHLLIDEKIEPIGKAVTATVKGDLHDVGKNLVRIMLEGVGFKVIDLGVDVSTDAIIDSIRVHTPDVLALSALLNTTLNQLANVIRDVGDAGLRGQVKIMVGGAPVDEEFAKRIGADAYADNAVAAAEVAKQLLETDQKVGGAKIVKESDDV
ncbi:MAG: cobalamin-dependent protein [Clostridiales Family XIII bacterium]|jgi:5-methyltetrahydrofolate--homocysteine methyltransferase|nr:cobalamin-dependent protein [Clostridiales Family XIII bacterium]